MGETGALGQFPELLELVHAPPINIGAGVRCNQDPHSLLQGLPKAGKSPGASWLNSMVVIAKISPAGLGHDAYWPQSQSGLAGARGGQQFPSFLTP